MMTLKQRLDAVWQHERIACANHLVRWNEKQIGYSTFRDLSLWYTKGTSRKPKQKKISKCYSILSKNYQAVWLYRIVQRNIK